MRRDIGNAGSIPAGSTMLIDADEASRKALRMIEMSAEIAYLLSEIQKSLDDNRLTAILLRSIMPARSRFEFERIQAANNGRLLGLLFRLKELKRHDR